MVREGRTQTSKSIDTINVHRTTPTNALATTPSKCQGGVNLVLNSDQSIQNHGSRLIQIKSVALHMRLLSWLVGIPAVDVEGLDLGFWV
jgi:hypothetical protein